MNPTQFVADFPEFGNAAIYPVSAITFWLNAAAIQLSANFGALLPLATELFVAHNLTLSQQATSAASSGGTPGSGTGVTASKSIDKVAVSYDTKAGTLEGAGSWNLTTYGTRFYQLVLMAGTCGYQSVGIGYVDSDLAAINSFYGFAQTDDGLSGPYNA